ncbi:MAG: DUF4864 domain-containing protein [Actinobacteria bacterium]|nr:DUF4864 domain-containing protein [Actinomycetota bacterium]
MRRLIALCVLVVLLSGCSQKAAFDELADGACSSEQAQLVDKHISAQIDAMAKDDWKLAYSLASPNFRSNVGIDQFIFVVSTQYGMLIDNQGYRFNSCTIANKKITQDVAVSSNSEVFNLSYSLSVDGEVLGVEASSITASDSKLQT